MSRYYHRYIRIWGFDSSLAYNYTRYPNQAIEPISGSYNVSESSITVTMPEYGASTIVDNSSDTSSAHHASNVTWDTIGSNYTFQGWKVEVYQASDTPDAPDNMLETHETYTGSYYKPGEQVVINALNTGTTYYVLTAVYTASEKYSGTVTYYADTNGTTFNSSYTYSFWTPIYKPTIPDRTVTSTLPHVHFAGWSNTPNAQYSSTYTWQAGQVLILRPSQTYCIYPVFAPDDGYCWRRIYYSSNYGVWGDSSLGDRKYWAISQVNIASSDTGSTFTARSEGPSRSGYTFDHWATASGQYSSGTTTYVEGTAYEPGDGVTLTGDDALLWLYPVYTAGAETTFTVTLDANGGTIDGDTVLTYTGWETSHTFAIPTPTYESHTFRGWYDGTTTSTATSYTVYAEDPTKALQAEWDATYTLRFRIYLDGWTGETWYDETKVSSTRSAEFTMPTAPTREGYRFKGYNGTRSYSLTSETVQPGTVVLVGTQSATTYSTVNSWSCVWEASTVTATVAYDVNGSALPVPVNTTRPAEVAEDGTYTATFSQADLASINDTKSSDGTYHRLLGWSTATSGSVPATVTVNNDHNPLTVYAIWSKIHQVTVRFLASDGSLFRSYGLQLGYDEEFTVRAGNSIPASDLVFRGWSYQVNGTDYVLGRNGIRTLTLSMFGSEQATYTIDFTAQYAEYEDVLPHASVLIYNDNGAYLDATYLQTLSGQAVVNRTENRAGSFSFTLVNDYNTAGHRLLADDCSLWSDGSAGPISCGQYVRIENIVTTSRTELLADGYITTIAPASDGTTISITCGDAIALACRQGTYVRRNYHGTGREQVVLDVGTSGDNATVDYTGVGAFDDDAVDYTEIVDDSIGNVYSDTREQLLSKINADRIDSLLDYTFPVDGPYVRQFGIWLMIDSTTSKSDAKLRMTLTSGGTASTVFTSLTSGSKAYVMNIAEGLPVAEGRCRLVLDLYDTGADKFGSAEIGVLYKIGTASSDYSYTCYNSGSPLTVSGKRLIGTFVHDGPWQTDTDITESSNVITMSIASSVFAQFPKNRARSYVLTTEISTTEVMSGLADTIGLDSTVDTSVLQSDATPIYTYRVGGGYVGDYLTKLADISDTDTGRMRSYHIHDGTVHIGSRYMVSDGALAVIKYGGDDYAGTLPSADFSSISTGITMKNRPNLVTYKTTINDSDGNSTPFTVSLEDFASTDRRGLLVESVASASDTASQYGAVAGCYAELNSNELDKWEGTVTLPGIVTAIGPASLMPTEGQYAGSGIPIALYDSRIGLSGAVTRVRQISWDFSSCTTTLTIGNYDATYSSSIADTVALPVTVSDLTAGAGSKDLYAEQYAYLTETADITVTTDTEVRLITGDGGQIVPDQVSVYKLPSSTLLLVRKAVTASTESSNAYDLQFIRVGGQAFEIPTDRRPDFYSGQTVTVAVQFRKP